MVVLRGTGSCAASVCCCPNAVVFALLLYCNVTISSRRRSIVISGCWLALLDCWRRLHEYKAGLKMASRSLSRSSWSRTLAHQYLHLHVDVNLVNILLPFFDPGGYFLHIKIRISMGSHLDDPEDALLNWTRSASCASGTGVRWAVKLVSVQFFPLCFPLLSLALLPWLFLLLKGFLLFRYLFHLCGTVRSLLNQ